MQALKKKAGVGMAWVLYQSMKFELDVTLTVGDLDEVFATCDLLRQRDMFRLPYPALYLESAVPEAVEHDRWIARRQDIDKDVLLRGEGYDEEQIRLGLLSYMLDDDIYIQGFRHHHEQQAHWDIGPGGCVIGAETPINYEHFLDKLIVPAVEGQPLSDTDDPKTMDNAKTQWLIAILCFGLVLLRTQGVERITSESCGLTKRTKPQDAYTIVRVRPRRRHGGGHDFLERKRPRLHLRRGHIRRQRYGRGLKRVKDVWIEPKMVGHREDGVVSHEYRAEV